MGLVALVAAGGVLATLRERAPAKPANTAAPTATQQASPADTGAATVLPAPTPASPSPTRAATSAAPPKLPATATFEVAANDSEVTVRSQDLGADLYRVTLAAHDDPVTPKVTTAGAIRRLTLVKDADTAAPPVTITLNSAVRWSLKMSAGNTETAADLSRSRLAALELAGGAHIFDLSLPPVTGTLPLRITHGMSQLKIRTNGRPVRLNLRVGAGRVVLDGEIHTDTTPGKVLISDGWSDATNRIDVDAVEGVGTLTVNTN
jgi:hypothetical protein